MFDAKIFGVGVILDLLRTYKFAGMKSQENET